MRSDYRHRVLDVGSALSQRSVFLFGPRQTGKFFVCTRTTQTRADAELQSPRRRVASAASR